MLESRRNIIYTAALTAAGISLMCVIVKNRYKILQHLRSAYDSRNALRHKRVEVIETAEDCLRIVNTLKLHCKEYRVLGFDCEWVTVGGRRRPTALLQLASHRGLCALFRLCSLKSIPISLRELLEDENVVKVGIGPNDDAGKLAHDYGAGVASTFDLRYLAILTNNKPEGLAKLAKSILSVHLDKHWRLVCSDWEAKTLTEAQTEYAAKDALVAIEIFKKMSNSLKKRKLMQTKEANLEDVLRHCDPYLEVRYKDSLFKNGVFVANKSDPKKISNGAPKCQTRGYSTRTKILYDNCLLEAPDGEILCTCDRKKAKWYVDQELGREVDSNPYTVRLNFEPAGRAVGEVGRYYQSPKENQCVVCGRKDAYIRKNVVPREYRKHFPVVMKSHTSHDILLLCPQCHQLSNISDLRVRTKLGKMCHAPYLNDEILPKLVEIPELRKLRSAARALLNNRNRIPPQRVKELQELVLSHYPEHKELTAGLLEESANIDIRNTAWVYTSWFEGGSRISNTVWGLIELEKLWREHFLSTMEPKFLPNLWNVNHNANRLEIRANEGRIDQADILLAGIDSSTKQKLNL